MLTFEEHLVPQAVTNEWHLLRVPWRLRVEQATSPLRLLEEIRVLASTLHNILFNLVRLVYTKLYLI